MVGLIRFLFFAFIFYLIYKGIKSLLSGSSSRKSTRYADEVNTGKNKKNGSSIDKKDIIEAEFEEIKDDKDKAND